MKQGKCVQYVVKSDSSKPEGIPERRKQCWTAGAVEQNKKSLSLSAKI